MQALRAAGQELRSARPTLCASPPRRAKNFVAGGECSKRKSKMAYGRTLSHPSPGHTVLRGDERRNNSHLHTQLRQHVTVSALVQHAALFAALFARAAEGRVADLRLALSSERLRLVRRQQLARGDPPGRRRRRVLALQLAGRGREGSAG